MESQPSASCEPFAIVLQIFITAFAIPHIRQYEHSITAHFSLQSIQPSQSVDDDVQRPWPNIRRPSTTTAMSLNGWKPAHIPSSISTFLQEVFPNLDLTQGSMSSSSQLPQSPTPKPSSVSQRSQSRPGLFSSLPPSSPPPPLRFPPSSPPPPLQRTAGSHSSSKMPHHHSQLDEKFASLGFQDSSSPPSFSNSPSSPSLHYARGRRKECEDRHEQLEMQLQSLLSELDTMDRERKHWQSIVVKMEARSSSEQVSQPDQPDTPIQVFGRSTAELFQRHNISPGTHHILFTMSQMSNKKVDWERYMQRYGLPAELRSALLDAMESDFIERQLDEASKNLGGSEAFSPRSKRHFFE